ncbi:hypothetical protein NHQ30_005895 [Ciborinia camelliae]|nr:hypothetical protein NHQ30_005895 [Ciborinia camelliae]
MPQYFPSISTELADWAMAQPLFFTASAPTHGVHVNVSPKGLLSSSFRIWGANSCAYIDATGSGVETISHIYENGRVTLMFCSFASSPRILRFFCTGRVVEWNTYEFSSLISKMEIDNGMGMEKKTHMVGARAVILLDVWKVQTSCGYGVPLLAAPSSQLANPALGPWNDRPTLAHWAATKVAKNELRDYQCKMSTIWEL